MSAIDAQAYTVVITRISEDDGSSYFQATAPAFGGKIAICGDTPEVAITAAYEAIPSVVEYLKEKGYPVPLPEQNADPRSSIRTGRAS